MKKALIASMVVALFVSCSANRSYDEYAPTQSQSPVSVMEDASVAKSGSVSIVVDDIEDVRTRIYDLTERLDGYIYYEDFEQVNAFRYHAVIQVALTNAAFLEFFNDVRTYGFIQNAMIQASIDYGSSVRLGEDDPYVEAQSLRSSMISIELSQTAGFGDYVRYVFHGFGQVLNVACPILLVALAAFVILGSLYFLWLLIYHSFLKKLAKKIKGWFAE